MSLGKTPNKAIKKLFKYNIDFSSLKDFIVQVYLITKYLQKFLVISFKFA